MKSIKSLVAAGIIFAGLIMFSSCEKWDDSSDINDQLAMSASDNIDAYLSQVTFVETGDLTSDELDMLAFMKEEEKLARDVYYYLYEQWGNQVFANIANSEENHITAIVRLLSFYSNEDTLVSEPGQFVNENLAALYTELTEKGGLSAEDALTIGATIEDLDINDLQHYLETTENENISLVFENLFKGSENHLRAFNRQLVNLGVTYEPQYISQEQFDEIISTTMQNGKGNGNGNGYKKGIQANQGTGECDGTGTGKQQKGRKGRG